jgi:Toxin PAAR-like domain
MSCDVYANNSEVSCKASSCKVIAAFPDVCLSPPSPPAGPIPIPYPDTSFAKDMMNGSKTVKIKGQEVMLKDQSFYKTMPLGDEAATQGLGAGVITHVITGKTYFNMWSMDVKFEGQNADRHLDITTSNHASPPPNEGLPIPTVGMMTPPGPPPPDPCKGVNCASLKKKIENIKKEIAKRRGELHEDPQGLPWDKPGAKPRETRKGHIKLLNEHKANLAKQKALYVACCGGDWDSI